MKKLIDSFISIIRAQVKPQKTNMVRMEGIDNIDVYYRICSYFADYANLDNCIIKLTREKYDEFCSKSQNQTALNFFLKGENVSLDNVESASFKANSFVDFDNAITKYRNRAPENDGATVLILLLGTEDAQDEGSLSETSYLITPQEIINHLKTNYSVWFEDVLESNGIKSQEILGAINRIYKTLFSSFNTDIVTLSEFIENADTLSFETGQEFVNYIFETLNEYWGIMSIKDDKIIPKVSKLYAEKGTVKILSDDIKFISGSEDIPTKSSIEKLRKKMDQYVIDCSIDKEAPFPEDNSVFPDFHEFQNCFIEYLYSKNLSKNRELLRKIDYSIIHRIIGFKIPRVSSEKPKAVTGEPVEVYSKMFFYSCDQFKNLYHTMPFKFEIQVNRIDLSNCLKENSTIAFSHICNFLGGILHFFNNSNLEIDGQLAEFIYDEDGVDDCFDFSCYSSMANKIKTNGKWGEPSRISFTIKASNDVDYHKFDFKWTFSPYAAWNNAFSYLTDTVHNQVDNDVLEFPIMGVCKNIQPFLCCESEEEFYSNLDQIDEESIYQRFRSEIRKYFKNTPIYSRFQLLCNSFKAFSAQIAKHGFFSSLSEIENCVKIYSDLMNEINSNYDSFSGVQRERIPLIVNCFVITSNLNVLENYDIAQAILPAYHPIMLEKIEAKQQFLREGFSDIFRSIHEDNTYKKNFLPRFEQLIQLSSITLGADSLYKKSNEYLPCKQMWEYAGVYYGKEFLDNIISSNAFGMSVVTDDDDSKAMLRFTPESNILVRNIIDYIHTFPACVDGLKIAFIAPSDMQHIVAAMHTVAKEFKNTRATIYLELICMNSKKNSTTYLKKWLDSFFVDENKVKIITYLKYLSVGNTNEISRLKEYIKNFDICFTYNILEPSQIEFDYSYAPEIDKDQPKFPMTLIPDTTALSHGQSRRVNVSQFQFLASKAHTQAIHKIGYPANKAGVYRVFNTLSLNNIQKSIVNTAHECCRWVVCIDPAIDKKMLESGRSNTKIIGFTTGEGNYGELNVTVSARRDTLIEIKTLLQKRLHDRFPNWSNDRLQAASKYCVEDLSENMDGSRILKALNPYDFEIHSFLAYVLTIQILNDSQNVSNDVVCSLISLDSYKHWFNSEDNMRPDFMLIEIPKTADNLNPNKGLKINIKIIECKMGLTSEQHIDKALKQIEKGLSVMSNHWNPQNVEVTHRYWLNQLYRSIIFSPINLPDNSEEYSIIREKIYTIIDGQIEIVWTGDIFAFWLDDNSETHNEVDITSAIKDSSDFTGIDLVSVKRHEFGQLFIQKMLLPQDKRNETFSFNEIEQIDVTEEDDVEANEITDRIEHVSPVISPIQESSIPMHPYEKGAAEINREKQRNESFDSRVTDVKLEESKTTVNEEAQADGEKYNPAYQSGNTSQNERKSISTARFLLGEDVKTREKYYWEFGNKELNNRHLLINGNSGCGKTYCIQSLLLEASLCHISSVVFDYTGGFAPSKLEPVFMKVLGSRIEQRFVRKDKIPVNPFKKQLIRMDEDFSYPEEDADVARKIADIFKSVYKTFGDQQFACMYDAILNGLRAHGEKMDFNKMVSELEAMGNARANTVLSKLRPFTDLNCFVKDETFSWESIRSSDGKVYIFQLAGYDRDTQILLTEFLLWDIWNFCAQDGDESRPIVLVMDEAQNLSHQENTPSAKILTEGRKFGISGWYATQFMKPQLDDAEIQRLQQAGQKLYFCPPDEGVMTVAKNIDISTQGSKDWAERLKKLKKGECVTCGNMVRNDRWTKYVPRIIKISSLQERISND